MAGAELRNIDVLLEMREALVRFRESTTNLSVQLRIRIERVEALLASRRLQLEREIEAQREIIFKSEDDDEREEAQRGLDEACEQLSTIRKRSRKLAGAVDHHNSVVTSWHRAVGAVLPAAISFLAQKHAEAENYRAIMPKSTAEPSSDTTVSVEIGSAYSVFSSHRLSDPASANSPDELPVLPSGFSWIPISQFDQSDLPTNNEFKKGISPSDMSNGLRRLWSELIPMLGENGRSNRVLFEAFDEANGRVDRMGFVRPDSLARLWDVFFDRRWKEYVRVTFDRRSGKWGVDNGRHRIKVARDLGWKFIPGEVISKPMDQQQ